MVYFFAAASMARDTTFTAAHSVSYPLTIQFGIPHGHAVELTLGRFLIINRRTEAVGLNKPRGIRYIAKTIAGLCGLLGGGPPEACAKRLYGLMAECGLETQMIELGVTTEADVEQALAGVNLERLGNNPVRITRVELREVLSPGKSAAA